MLSAFQALDRKTCLQGDQASDVSDRYILTDQIPIDLIQNLEHCRNSWPAHDPGVISPSGPVATIWSRINSWPNCIRSPWKTVHGRSQLWAALILLLLHLDGGSEASHRIIIVMSLHAKTWLGLRNNDPAPHYLVARATCYCLDFRLTKPRLMEP